MALLRVTVAFLTLHLAAAASSSCPATATGRQQTPPHALLQKSKSSARRVLKTEAKVDAASSSNQTTTGPSCPWLATTKVNWQLQCVDGTLCDSWSCCIEHGGRGKCPPNRPLMCARKSCSGDDHCCKTSCLSRDGLRPCPAGELCHYRGTTDEVSGEANDKMECVDKTTCSGSGCCASHGGVVKCPPTKPLMCNSQSCNGDYCCDTDCSALGGMRSCMGSVTMVGNSFTHYNNGVDAVLRVFFSATIKARDVVPLTKGGADWGYHVAEANTPGTPHHETLIQGPHADFVVVQEQSYIPGTCCCGTSMDTFAKSLANLTALSDMIAAQGAMTVLYQTWGWRDGHGSRSCLSTFDKFNAEVAKGYQMYKAHIETLGRPVVIAPVGDAFKIIHDRPEGNGPTSLFYRLYNADGRHPSELGTYLAGCVIYAMLTAEKPVGLPAPGIPADDAAVLQAVADMVVFPA